MSGGQYNPAEGIAFTVYEAVDYAGLIVTMGATANYANICAASSDEPMGYTFTNSKHPITAASQAAQKVTIMALIEGQIVEGVLPATHGAIAVGNELMCTAAGKIIKKTGGAGWVVGRAMAAVDENTGGYLKFRVSKRYVSA